MNCVTKMKERDIASFNLSRIEDVIYVLHCFEKKSREMPRRDFEKAKRRLKAVNARLVEEKKREKRS